MGSDSKNRVLTAAESAAYLGYTLRSFYKIKWEIPHRKTRGILYFKLSDLDAFNESRSVQHVPTKANEGVS